MIGDVPSEKFRNLVEQLVKKCDGNMPEAARRSGLTTPLISRTLAGDGPVDPKSATMQKIYAALGIKSGENILREARGEYIVKDKYFKLAQFVKLLPPERQAPFFDLAKVYGFNLKEEHRQEDGDHVEKTA